MTTKCCSKCKTEKPLADFGKNKKHSDGLQCWCRQCCSVDSKRWRTANPEESKRHSREYYHKNAEGLNEERRESYAIKMAADPIYRDIRKAQTKRWKNENPEKRAAHLTTSRCKRYGLTPTQLEVMRRLQNNCCACCGDKFVKEPHIDHCHKTKKVRALLCALCNRGLGYFKDSSLRCFLAASFLQKFGS